MVVTVAPNPAENGTATSQFIGVSISSLCSLLPRPLIMTGIFREILVRHFQEADNIENPELKHLLWQKGEQTNILVESVHRWRPELTEHRPAVILKRNAFKNQRFGIADRHLGSSADIYGNEHFTTFWIGSHTLFCIGASGAQAELLATEVLREVHHFHEVIRRTAKLHRLAVLEVGPIAELEEAVENFVVPVSIGYAYEDSWVVREEAPTLRSVSFSYITEC
jgi:hypothetical protein